MNRSDCLIVTGGLKIPVGFITDKESIHYVAEQRDFGLLSFKSVLLTFTYFRIMFLFQTALSSSDFTVFEQKVIFITSL